jgi:stage V sporulation protein D (sporulation-specific penicillin-binding protein)
MRQVIQRGTGRRCRLDRWSSFGKTGTAQIAGPGGYVQGAYVGSFVGGAPATNPRLLCLISVYWPDVSKEHYGSVVAAPFVKQVLARSLAYLKVPSDKDISVASVSAP